MTGEGAGYEPAVDRQRSEFDERNNFLHFVLGLISLSGTALGVVGSAEQAGPEPGTPEPARDRPWLRGVL